MIGYITHSHTISPCFGDVIFYMVFVEQFHTFLPMTTTCGVVN